MVFGFGKKKATEVAPEGREEQVRAVSLATDDEEEIIAVIAAAVAYYTQGGGVVTTIRRVTAPSAPIWSLVGRQEIMNLRQI